MRPAGPVETETSVRSGAEASLLLATFRLRETTPDSVGLPDCHRIFEAIASNGTDLANGLRPDLSALPLFFALRHIRREEQMGVASAARSNRLPGTIERRHYVCPPGGL